MRTDRIIQGTQVQDHKWGMRRQNDIGGVGQQSINEVSQAV